jgi:hypothetical protein
MSVVHCDDLKPETAGSLAGMVPKLLRKRSSRSLSRRQGSHRSVLVAEQRVLDLPWLICAAPLVGLSCRSRRPWST